MLVGRGDLAPTISWFYIYRKVVFQMKIAVTLLMLLVLLLSNAYAQEYVQWELPEGAVARLGKGTIGTVQYSPDGTRLAVASSIGIWLYDAATYQEVALIAGHQGSVRSVVFSPDGQMLAATDWDGTLRLWDAVTGENRWTATADMDVECVVFSPNGLTLVGAGGLLGDVLLLWDTSTWEYREIDSGHRYRITSLAFSPKGRIVASGSRDGTVRLWDTVMGDHKGTLTSPLVEPSDPPKGGTGKHERRIIGPRGRKFHCVAFSPDGQTIAGGG